MEQIAILIDRFEDPAIILGAGLVTGLAFGAAAQQSRFCLRAATIEFWRGAPAGRFAIWLFVFATALLLTQWQLLAGHLDPGAIRQLTGTGSISGALIGGALFGAGMVLARGCASRLLVLSGTGNLRALVTGLVLTITAQASLTGILSPLREDLAALWLVSGPARDLTSILPPAAAPALGPLLLATAGILARRAKLPRSRAVFALITGAAIALGWGLTAMIANWSFDPVAVQSVTFTGPSADTLMALITQDSLPMSFATGLVPGVFLGAMAAAILTREWTIQTFDAGSGMIRYMIGAVLMGFGGMLAGGCAVGAGVTGGSVMATTAWTALAAMWLSAGLTDLAIDRPGAALNPQTS